MHEGQQARQTVEIQQQGCQVSVSKGPINSAESECCKWSRVSSYMDSPAGLPVHGGLTTSGPAALEHKGALPRRAWGLCRP